MKKIIVIEDDINILKNIHDLLEVEGYKVYTSDNGKDGLALVMEIIPDLVICDIMLPGLSGYEVLANLINEEITAGIPLIFLTAKAERENIRLGMELGADDYITKPFKAAELLKAIEARLKKSELLKRASSGKKPGQVTHKQKLSGDEHLFVFANNSPKFIKINDIKCITAEAEYTYVHSQKDEKLLVRKLLKDWEKLLPESYFIRIHRSTIINLNYIVKTEKMLNNSFIVYLQGISEAFTISRRFAALLKTKTPL